MPSDLISCIMPTRARQQFAAAALGLWKAQTWSNRELVIVDDAAAPSFPAGCHEPGVQYHRLTTRLTIGEKRNIAVARASGDIIAHWDDDDWSAPGRLEDQVHRLGEGFTATGYNWMHFTDGARWWIYRGAIGYALGTSLMYRRREWRQHPFPAERKGEDNDFVSKCRMRLCSVDAEQMMVARIHPANTSNKTAHMNPAQWLKVEQPRWWQPA